MEFSLVMASSQEKSIFDADDTYLAPLQVREGDNNLMLAILLKCIRGNHYRRISSGEVISLPAWNHRMLGQMAQRKVVQVKQEDDFQRSFFGIYQYKFFVASNVLSLRGFEVTSRYASSSNWSSAGARRLESGLLVWDDQDASEKSILIDYVGVEGVTAALEFTRQIEETHTSHDINTTTEPAAAEFEEAETQIANPASYAESERFVAIFNVYATRTRLGIIIPKKEETIQSLLDQLFQYHRSGDWMTAAQDLFPEPRLSSEARITAELIRDHSELGLTSYEAKISFEEARAELPNNEVLPFELPNNEIKTLPWHIFPKVPELENTFISNRKPHMVQNLMSADPTTNRYIASFLQHKDLEKQRHKHELNELEDDDIIDPESDEVEGNDLEDDQVSEAADEAEQRDRQSHSMQLEIQELRRESVSPVLPDLHRMSGFGVDLFQLPLFSEHEEPVPPLPAEFAFSLSKPTFAASRTESPEPLSPTSPEDIASDPEEAGNEEHSPQDDGNGIIDEGERSIEWEGQRDVNDEGNIQEANIDGYSHKNVSHIKERRKRKGNRATKSDRKGKSAQK